MKLNFDIDFTVLWVDSNDPKWQQDFIKYKTDSSSSKKTDTRIVRYRDNGLLRYWFRGVEKFAPWVHKIHFITCGQKPDWLNTENPKLHWVKHEDYIEKKYLPLFNSTAIEISMHKIPGLAEHFVHFNDDFFLTGPVSPSYYFTNKGQIKDMAFLFTTSLSFHGHRLMNNEILIDKLLNKNKCVKSHKSKWLNPIYGKKVFSTLYFWKRVNHSFIRMHHFSQPYCKKHFEDMWNLAGNELEKTIGHRFRSIDDYNHNIFREYALFTGDFKPFNHYKRRKFYDITSPTNKIIKSILSPKVQEIVINDQPCDDYESRINKIKEAFETLLPEKSSFEL